MNHEPSPVTINYEPVTINHKFETINYEGIN